MCWPMKTIFACGLRTFRPNRASVRVLDASVQSGLLRGPWHTTARLQSVVSECLPVQKVGHVAVVAEIAYAFGTDDVAAPSGSDEMVEFVNVECRTAVINESTDAVFFHFAPFVMVMMMMVSVLFVMMFMFFFVVMMSVRFFFFLFGGWFLYPANPSCRGSHAFEVEQVCMYNLL